MKNAAARYATAPNAWSVQASLFRFTTANQTHQAAAEKQDACRFRNWWPIGADRYVVHADRRWPILEPDRVESRAARIGVLLNNLLGRCLIRACTTNRRMRTRGREISVIMEDRRSGSAATREQGKVRFVRAARATGRPRRARCIGEDFVVERHAVELQPRKLHLDRIDASRLQRDEEPVGSGIIVTQRLGCTNTAHACANDMSVAVVAVRFFCTTE